MINLKNKKVAILVLIISLIALSSSLEDGEKEGKKQAVGTTLALTGTVGSLAWMGLLGNPITWVVGGIAALLFLGPGLITNWMDLFRPQPTIPIWVYIAGFLVLMMFVMRKK